jgi:hypothetical protein
MRQQCKNINTANQQKACEMNKAEALAVMHEILTVCQETIPMDSISLDSSQGSQIYNIRLKYKLDNEARTLSSQL